MKVRWLLVVAVLLMPSAGLAAWTNEFGGTGVPCGNLGSSNNRACRNIFIADAAQNTPVLGVQGCESFVVDLHLSGGATATGFIQSCVDTAATICTDLHTGALNGTTVFGYNNAGPNTYIRGRMTAVTLGAGAAQLKATCGTSK